MHLRFNMEYQFGFLALPLAVRRQQDLFAYTGIKRIITAFLLLYRTNTALANEFATNFGRQ